MVRALSRVCAKSSGAKWLRDNGRSEARRAVNSRARVEGHPHFVRLAPSTCAPSTPALASRARSLDPTPRGHSLGLDLDLPARVEKPGDDHHGRGRPDAREDVPVRAAHLGSAASVRDVDARPHDVGQRSSRFREGALHDLEAAPSLGRGAGIAGAVRPDRRGACDQDSLPHAHRATETDRALERRARCDSGPVRVPHRPGVSGCRRVRARAVAPRRHRSASLGPGPRPLPHTRPGWRAADPGSTLR
jgi:hypothetical protein